MSRPTVALLDYGSGNLRSAERALARAGADVTVTAERSTSPRTPTASSCPASARSRRAWRASAPCRATASIGRRLAGGRPVLGICVGMQVLFEQGDEHGVDDRGLRRVARRRRRAARAGAAAHGLEHRRRRPTDSQLFAGLDADTRFYFVHSYAARSWDARHRATAAPRRRS